MPRINFRESLLVLLVLFGALGTLFPGTFLHGEAIGPADLCYSYSPWRLNNPLKIKPKHNILSDQFDEILPNIKYQIDQLRAGHIPSYTDKLYNGVPLFWVIRHEAKMLLLLGLGYFLTFPVAWTLFLIVRLLIGGLFFYYFLRLLNISSGAALVGTLSYAFSSYVIQNFGITMVSQYFLLPVALYAIERIIRDRSRLWIFILPFVAEQILVSGYPTTAAYNLFLIAIYGLFRIIQERASWRSNLLLFAWLGAITLALAAPALLASVNFFATYDWSYRVEYWRASLPPSKLLTMLMPFYFGEATVGAWVRHSVYLGFIPLIAAVFGVVGSFRSGLRLFFVLYALWVFSFAFNLFNLLSVIRYVPVFNSSMPNNHIILIPFALSVLAAFGLDDFKTRVPRLNAALAIGALLLIFGVGIKLTTTEFSASLTDANFLTHLKTQTLFLTLSLAALLYWAFGERKTLALATLLLILGADLTAMGKGFNPTVPQAGFFPETKGITFLKEHLGEHKLFLFEREFLANAPQYFGLRTFGGRGFFPARTKELYRLIYPEAFVHTPTQEIFPFNKSVRVDSELFDALGIKYLLVPKNSDPKRLEREYAYNQKEWNAFIKLGAGQTLTQTFKPPSNTTADKLTLRLAENLSPAPIKFKVSVFVDEKQLWSAESEAKKGATGNLNVNIPPTEFNPSFLYRLEIELLTPTPNSKPVSLQWAEGVDIIRTGTLSEDGHEKNGDLLFEIYADNSVKKGLTDKLKVAYDDDLTIWENQQVFPRAWFVSKAKVLDDNGFKAEFESGKLGLREFAVVDPKDQAQVVSLLTDQTAPAIFAPTPAQITKLTDTAQEFELQNSAPGILVISDNFDEGWSAKIDDRPAKILRVNFNMRGIVVPAGAHRVVLEYAPSFLRNGLLILLTGLLLLLLSLFFIPKFYSRNP